MNIYSGIPKRLSGFFLQPLTTFSQPGSHIRKEKKKKENSLPRIAATPARPFCLASSSPWSEMAHTLIPKANTLRRKTGLRKIVGPIGISPESGRGRLPTKKDLKAPTVEPHPPLGVAPRDLSQHWHPLLGAGAPGDAGSTSTLLQVSLPGPSL